MHNKIKYHYLLLFLFLVSLPVDLYSQTMNKSKTVYNLLKFLEWDKLYWRDSDNINIYILNSTRDFTEFKSYFKNKSIEKKKIQVFLTSKVPDGKKCDILYIPPITSNLEEVLGWCEKNNVLSISSELDDFCSLGGIVNLVEQKSCVKIELNNKKALESNFIFSAQILRLVEIKEFPE